MHFLSIIATKASGLSPNMSMSPLLYDLSPRQHQPMMMMMSHDCDTSSSPNNCASPHFAALQMTKTNATSCSPTSSSFFSLSRTLPSYGHDTRHTVGDDDVLNVNCDDDEDTTTITTSTTKKRR